MRLIHVYHTAPNPDPETKRRNAIAAMSRRIVEEREEGSFRSDPLPIEHLPRRFIEDGNRQMAFVKDVVDVGLTACQPDDLFMLTNEDTGLYPSLCSKVFPMFTPAGRLNGLSGPRRDFGVIDHPLTSSEENGAEYIGTDIFIFTPAWWAMNRDNFPDMVLGGEAWDLILRGMMRMQGMPSVSNLVYHEFHEARWTRADVRNSSPMQIHNRRLCEQWMARRTPGEREMIYYADPVLENKHRNFTTDLANRRAN
jgi:hypothetical protein